MMESIDRGMSPGCMNTIGHMSRSSEMHPSASTELIEVHAPQVVALIEGSTRLICRDKRKTAAARNVATAARKYELQTAMSK